MHMEAARAVRAPCELVVVAGEAAEFVLKADASGGQLARSFLMPFLKKNKLRKRSPIGSDSREHQR